MAQHPGEHPFEVIFDLCRAHIYSAYKLNREVLAEGLVMPYGKDGAHRVEVWARDESEARRIVIEAAAKRLGEIVSGRAAA